MMCIFHPMNAMLGIALKLAVTDDHSHSKLVNKVFYLDIGCVESDQERYKKQEAPIIHT